MDIEILKSIAAASGRETFITNSGFGLLWSNSQRDLLELISIGGCTDMLRRTDHETVIRCEDQALHIIPVIMDGERIYFFELVAPAFAAELFRKTAAFDAMYARLRGTIDGYSSELSPIALQDPSCAARMNRLTASLANQRALLELLTKKDTELFVDIGEHIEFLVKSQMMARLQKALVSCSLEIERGIVCFADRRDVDYTVINMLSNVILHARPATLTVMTLRVAKDGDYCLIETEDNGTQADLARIKGFSTLYPDRNVLKSGEQAFTRSGIALIYAFAEKFGGYAEASLTESGGLRMSVRIKRCTQPNVITLYSPGSDTGSPENITLRSLLASVDFSIAEHRGR